MHGSGSVFRRNDNTVAMLVGAVGGTALYISIRHIMLRYQS
jgi:hypothetical protein